MKRFKSKFLVVAIIFSNLFLGVQAADPYTPDSIHNFSFVPRNSKLNLSPLFTNHMVIQREKPVLIWGTTSPNNQVSVTLDKTKKSVSAKPNGYWEVKFKPLPVGGPYEMEISTNDTIVKIVNILSGDVWFCSGQSNMQFQLRYDKYVDEEAPNATNPNIRMLRIPHNVSLIDNNQVIGETKWLECNPTNAKLFSAVGYYFGKKVQTETQIPIGLIGSYWGGSAIESWTSKNAISKFPVFNIQLKRLYAGDISISELKKGLDAETERRLEVIKQKENPNTKPYTPYALQHVPSLTYNGMVAPFTKFPIKGVIWYQAEANASRAHQYASLFQALIKDWRKQWKNSKMPFYFVQIPNYGVARKVPSKSQWAELRESQTKALKLKNTGMAVTIDVGEVDLHPKDKRTVGNRLAIIALNRDYKKNVAYQSPMFKSYRKTSRGSIICEFSNVGTGLQIKGGEVTEFTIAGENKKFYNAKIKLIGKNAIEVSAPQVKNPVSVRYAWSNFPTNGLLYNSDNLPLSPFRTDEWPETTYGVY